MKDWIRATGARIGWFAAGCALMLVAVISVPLPIPTTPFVIASLLAFARASRRVQVWLNARALALARSRHEVFRKLGQVILKVS